MTLVWQAGMQRGSRWVPRLGVSWSSVTFRLCHTLRAGVWILTALLRLLRRWLGWWPCVEEGSVAAAPAARGRQCGSPLCGQRREARPRHAALAWPQVCGSGTGSLVLLCSLSPVVQRLASAPVGFAWGLPQPRGARPSKLRGLEPRARCQGQLCVTAFHTRVPPPSH